MRFLCFLIILILLQGCDGSNNIVDGPIIEGSMYFPPVGTDAWDSVSTESLGWNAAATEDLYNFLSQNKTRGFILLYKGKIVLEKYWGNTIQNNTSFDKNSNWYWASAGKTMTAFLVGIAQEKGLLQIDEKTSDYLGMHWTGLSTEKQALITIRHQLSMTTGLDYTVANLDCTAPECLQYKADAGDQWYYHNAPYTLLENVVSEAAGQTYNEFTDQHLESKTGINGQWLPLGDNNVYWSTPRDAARFGLLLLNKGKWSEEQLMTDAGYFKAMTTSSQSLNPSYGYCTWLNGKSAIILPGNPNSFKVPLSKNAPSDLFAAMGKNGQFIVVVPSKNIVVIRMGEAPDGSLVPTVFHDKMWQKINAVID